MQNYNPYSPLAQLRAKIADLERQLSFKVTQQLSMEQSIPLQEEKLVELKAAKEFCDAELATMNASLNQAAKSMIPERFIKLLKASANVSLVNPNVFFGLDNLEAHIKTMKASLIECKAEVKMRTKEIESLKQELADAYAE